MNKESAMTQIQTIMVMSAIMIVLFVLGVILVVWNPIPEKIPQASIEITGEGDSVIMNHLNGDSFSSDRLVVKVNGNIEPNQNLNFQTGSWPWSPDERINFYYPSPDSPRVVEIYYLTDKGESILIDKARLEPPPVVSATPLPVEIVINETPTPAPSMIPVQVRDANPVQPPVGDFTAEPLVGDPPLTVTFHDLSYGKVDDYTWSFGDGSTSTLQHPVHTYFVPGTYTVSLLVSNTYGSNRRTAADYITVGSPPVAKFIAEPGSGQAPLTVQFTDLSTGNPKSWEWSFGDGTQSSDKNPVHIFQGAGSFNVTLSVTNAYGTDKYSPESALAVTAPTLMDVYLTNSVNGALVPDGYIRLRVTDPASSMKIAGKIYPFEVGDMIQLIYGPGSSDGVISTDKNKFTSFNFNDITLVKNGETIARGPVNTFSIGGFDSYASTLNLSLPKGDSYDTLYINSEPYKYVESPSLQFSGIGPDTTGRFFYQKSAQNMNFQGGIAELTLG
ncbi:MAG: PKD domain-containing protein [Methanospirillum sp.]|nr:PKD domain-containing protein [Methanospirillum sp.]